MNAGMFQRDFRYAVRVLLAHRMMTAAIVLSLGLGIGATTTVFSFANAVLFQPLPYQQPQRLVFLWASKDQNVTRGISFSDFSDLLAQNHSFEDIVPLFGITGQVLTLGANQASSVTAMHVGANLFSVLGVSPYLGRTWESERDGLSDEKTVLVSYTFWKIDLGASPTAVGREVDLNGEQYRVAGVMPPGFFFPIPSVQVWLPIARSEVPMQRGTPVFNAVARLQRRVNIRTAQSDVDTVAQRLSLEYADTDKNLALGVFSLKNEVLGSYRAASWALLGGMFLLLSVGCANVVHLLLVSGIRRSSEIAVRCVHGATRGSILRQLLTESGLLSAISGMTGIVIAVVAVHLLHRMSLVDIPRFGLITVDLRAVLFALVISVASTLLFGLLPAIRISRSNLLSSLRQGESGYSYGAKSRLRDLLIFSEIACAFVLMVGAGLLVNSFVRLSRLRWGFDPSNLLVVDTVIPHNYWNSAPFETTFADQVLFRLQSLPGVRSVGIACGSPIKNWSWKTRNVALNGAKSFETRQWIVGPGYFQTLGIQMLHGRGFVTNDHDAGAKEVVIESALAEELWPGRNPVGQTLLLLIPKKDVWEEFLKLWQAGRGGDSSRLLNAVNSFDRVPFEVIGEVGPIHMFGPLPVDSDPSIFLDYRERPFDTSMTMESFFLRTLAAPSALAETARNAVHEADAAVKIQDVSTMEERVTEATGGHGSNRLLLLISSTTGLLGALLAAIGIYGTLDYQVTLRVREIGVRMAFGASRYRILRMVLVRNFLVTGTGLLFGVVIATMGTKLLSSYLFAVKPTDLQTYGGCLALFLCVAFIASYFPARRATCVDPLSALRHE